MKKEFSVEKFRKGYLKLDNSLEREKYLKYVAEAIGKGCIKIRYVKKNFK